MRKAIKKKNDRKKVVMQRLTNIDKGNHVEAIEESVQENVINEVKNQLPKFLPKVVFNYVKPRLERMVLNVMNKNLINLLKSSFAPAGTLTEYELKQNLYDMMHKSRSFLAHNKHLELYNAFMNSMGVDEYAAKDDLDCTPSQHKRSHDDQDPLEDHEGEKNKKRRQKDVGGSSSKKSKAQDESPHYEIGDDAEEPRQEQVIEHEIQYEVPGKHKPVWFQERAKELPVQSWFNDLVDVKEEPTENELINGSIVIFGKCMKKFLNKDKITKEDLEGPAFQLLKKRFRNSVKLECNIKQCHLVVSDMIDWDNPEGNRFHDDISKLITLTGPPGTEEMIPYLWIHSIQMYNKDAELGIHHWDEHRHWFYKDEHDLINALQLYIRIIVIKKRVEDVQLGVESYQTKLNLTKPQLMEGCFSQKVMYTILSHPIGIVYEGTDNRKRLRRANELHKFSDGTINKVYNKLKVILRNNRLGYHNEGMKEYKWTKKDQERTQNFIKKIKKMLKERIRLRRLEFFIGGRRNMTDYRLLVRPK
nr:hypothetical protein [Tanacetum cinerariifolium]